MISVQRYRKLEKLTRKRPKFGKKNVKNMFYNIKSKKKDVLMRDILNNMLYLPSVFEPFATKI